MFYNPAETTRVGEDKPKDAHWTGLSICSIERYSRTIGREYQVWQFLSVKKIVDVTTTSVK